MSRTEQSTYRVDLGSVAQKAAQQRSFMHFRKAIPEASAAVSKLAGKRRADIASRPHVESRPGRERKMTVVPEPILAATPPDGEG